MFVDASAIVAIITIERDHEPIARRLDSVGNAITSALAIYEAVLAIARKQGVRVAQANSVVERFCDRAGIQVAPITAETAGTALDTFLRYGKGQGHPARLNMGDCFAYAMAKQHAVPLLYKGDDFAHTDLA